jgi:hypothetical protein
MNFATEHRIFTCMWNLRAGFLLQLEDETCVVKASSCNKTAILGLRF